LASERSDLFSLRWTECSPDAEGSTGEMSTTIVNNLLTQNSRHWPQPVACKAQSAICARTGAVVPTLPRDV
jgi:hypothetical protein